MAFREILLTLVVVAICAAALVRPRVGLYGYVWYATMRPDVMAWCEDLHNYSMYMAICTLIGSAAYLGRSGRLVKSWTSKVFLLLQVPLLASTLLAVDPNLSYDRYTEFVKSFVVLLLIPLLIEETQHLKRLVLITGLSVGMIGLKFGGFGLLHGGVILVNGYGGQMSDNNLLGLALATMTPLCWYGRGMTENKFLRFFLLIIIGVSIAGIVMTNSRGSQLALASVFVCAVLRSKKKLGLVLVLAVVAGGAVYLVRDAYLERMATIVNYEQEASAFSRVEHARAALAMWEDHPLIGVGFGGLNYLALASHYMGKQNEHVAHNTYLQMLVDSGIGAFVIYLVLLVGGICWLGFKIRQLKQDYPELAVIGIALQTSLVAFSVGGTFYSSQRYDLPYIVLMCCAAWDLLVRERPDPAPCLEEESGLEEPAA